MSNRARTSLGLSRNFTQITDRVARLTGRPTILVLACVVVVVWAIAGPVFHFSDSWQLTISTGTSIITFLMVFLIQATQNRDGAAVQVKLDEIIRALEPAKNKFMGIEKLTIEGVQEMRDEIVEDVKALRRSSGSRRSERDSAVTASRAVTIAHSGRYHPARFGARQRKD